MASFKYLSLFKESERKRNEAIRESWWKLEDAIMNYLHQKN
jgi:hypothetical protein